MSEFNLSSALQAWRFRKWYFIIPAVLIPVAAVVVALKLPAIYESRSTILIEEQQIPPEFVRSTVTGYADQHVQILTQQILSRTKLWEIVEQFNLYAKERQKSSKEAILDQMRQDISFETISAQAGEGGRSRNRPGGGGLTIAFRIAYRGEDPAMLQKVTSTLSSLYLEQNLKFREEQAQTTTRFLEAELNELRNKISTLGERIAEFKAKNPGSLPEMSQFNLTQATSLENEIKTLDSNIQAAENQKIYLEGLLGTTAAGKGEGESGPPSAKDPRGRLAAVNEELTLLKARLSEEHPDVQRLLREKAQLENILKARKAGDIQTQQKLAQLQTELAVLQGKFSDAHPDVKKLKNEIAQVTAEADKGTAAVTDVDLANPAQLNMIAQVQQLTNQVASLKQLRQKQVEKLAMFRQRLEETPRIEQEYLALQRDYQNSHNKYHDVMNKLMEARISEGMEQHQKGQRFTLVDPASFPEEPVKPNRKQIMLAGLVLGLGMGMALMLGRESVDTSIKSAAELAGLTKMPPLGIIARIITPLELARKRRIRQLFLAATCLSLVLGVALVHFFYMDLDIVLMKVQRLANRL
ncbi:MAG: hypothetical protein FJ135_17210 [Deltaproteobacteria bacterium]|nr:hypothetical protein [Deltaproteobacteria bacterium]